MKVVPAIYNDNASGSAPQSACMRETMDNHATLALAGILQFARMSSVTDVGGVASSSSGLRLFHPHSWVGP